MPTSGLTAKLAGGANMFNGSGPLQIGDANAEAVAAALKEAGIPVAGQDVGGTRGRRVEFRLRKRKNDCPVCRPTGANPLKVTPCNTHVVQRTGDLNDARTLLVADDALIIRQIIRDMATDAGWTVVGEATTARRPLISTSSSPDAVTLDLVMPEHDRFYALHGIMKFDPQAKVLLVSRREQR